MRRIRALMSSALLAVGTVGGAVIGGAAPAAAAPPYQLALHGEIGLAAWTTCPEVTVGATCRDTVVIASNTATRETSDQPTGGNFLHERGPNLILQEFNYRIVETPDGILAEPTTESFGGTTDATVTIPTRLTSGVASAASIPMTTTDYSDGTQYAETRSLHVTWQPAGVLEPLKQKYISMNNDQFSMESSKGWTRAATATGEDNGTGIPGELAMDFTTLLHVRQAELRVVKGNWTPEPAGAPLAAVPVTSTGATVSSYSFVDGSAFVSNCATTTEGTCREAYLQAGRMTPKNGSVQSFGLVDMSEYTVTNGEPVFVGERFAKSTTGVSVVAPADLSMLSVDATDVPGQECTFAGQELVCVGTTLSFSGQLSGTGALTPFTGHSISMNGKMHSTFREKGVLRTASATVSVDGSVVGSTDDARLRSGRAMEASH